jgi:hypothetical protein
VIEEKWVPKKLSPAAGADHPAGALATEVIEEKWFPEK